MNFCIIPFQKNIEIIKINKPKQKLWKPFPKYKELSNASLENKKENIYDSRPIVNISCTNTSHSKLLKKSDLVTKLNKSEKSRTFRTEIFNSSSIFGIRSSATADKSLSRKEKPISVLVDPDKTRKKEENEVLEHSNIKKSPKFKHKNQVILLKAKFLEDSNFKYSENLRKFHLQEQIVMAEKEEEENANLGEKLADIKRSISSWSLSTFKKPKVTSPKFPKIGLFHGRKKKG